MNDYASKMKYIKHLLIELGISPALMGYGYLAQCVYLCWEDNRRLHSLVADVYREVARQNNTTYQRVERNIRHAVRAFADRNRVQSLNRMFGVKLYNTGDYPPNGELIGYLTEYVQMHFGEWGPTH